MFGSVIVYSGLIMATAGLGLVIRPRWLRPRWLRITNRARALAVVGAGALLTGMGLTVPAPESRVGRVETRLDEFAPRWQFREYHEIRIAAPPARVFQTIKRVRADEIFLFHTLTGIRRGGQATPENILNPGTRRSLPCVYRPT